MSRFKTHTLCRTFYIRTRTSTHSPSAPFSFPASDVSPVPSLTRILQICRLPPTSHSCRTLVYNVPNRLCHVGGYRVLRRRMKPNIGNVAHLGQRKHPRRIHILNPTPHQNRMAQPLQLWLKPTLSNLADTGAHNHTIWGVGSSGFWSCGEMEEAIWTRETVVGESFPCNDQGGFVESRLLRPAELQHGFTVAVAHQVGI